MVFKVNSKKCPKYLHMVVTRVVVAGATGAIGRHCINLLVKDPRILSVTALIREDERTAEFYGLNDKYDDMNKLKHLRIDYNDKENLANKWMDMNFHQEYHVLDMIQI